MLWLKRLNFMETAKLEMELMKAFESGEDLDSKVRSQFDLAKQSGLAEDKWKAEVWEKMLARIRKMQKLMAGTDEPQPKN
tara:strand:+ start:1032 stop:1271 length:240 start_codon:yes stop_codon:yes gene_type:complete